MVNWRSLIPKFLQPKFKYKFLIIELKQNMLCGDTIAIEAIDNAWILSNYKGLEQNDSIIISFTNGPYKSVYQIGED